MKRLLPTLCLMAILAISLTSCAKDIPIYREHTHAYVATHTRGTCLQFGHTEYRCHCGDRYTVSDTEYGSHSYAPAVVNSDSRRAVILESSGEYLTAPGADIPASRVVTVQNAVPIFRLKELRQKSLISRPCDARPFDLYWRLYENWKAKKTDVDNAFDSGCPCPFAFDYRHSTHGEKL